MLASKSKLRIIKTIREADTNLDWYKISYLWGKDRTIGEVKGKIDEFIPLDQQKKYKIEIEELKRKNLGDNGIFIMQY